MEGEMDKFLLRSWSYTNNKGKEVYEKSRMRGNH
jgi:hypothetical protein